MKQKLVALIAAIVLTAASVSQASPPPNVRIAVRNNSGATLSAFDVTVKYMQGQTLSPAMGSFRSVAPGTTQSYDTTRAFEQSWMRSASGRASYSDGRSMEISYYQFDGYWGLTMCGNCPVKYKVEWNDYTILFTIW